MVPMVLFPKVHLSPIKSVLNAIARLIARFPILSHVSSLIVNILHWVPLLAHIQFNILGLVLKSKVGVVPKKYCRDRIHSPLSSHWPSGLIWSFFCELGLPWPKLKYVSTISGHPYGMPFHLLYASPFSMGLFPHPSCSSKLFSTPRDLSVEAQLNWYGWERCHIN